MLSSLNPPSQSQLTFKRYPPFPDSPLANEEKLLASRLHQFPCPSAINLTNLVNLPPKLEAVPVKPFFFDIAYSYVGLEEKNMRVPASNVGLGGGGGNRGASEEGR